MQEQREQRFKSVLRDGWLASRWSSQRRGGGGGQEERGREEGKARDEGKGTKRGVYRESAVVVSAKPKVEQAPL